MPLSAARHTLVECQLRTSNVHDSRILELFGTLPRELFVAPHYAAVAYTDTPLPLDSDTDAQMPPAREQALLLQALNIQAADQALEIGCGPGYISCMLAQLAQSVTSCDSQASLLARAQQNAAALNIRNIEFKNVQQLADFTETALFDVIYVQGSFEFVPDHLLHLLKENGRCVIIAGNPPIMQAIRITRDHSNEFKRDILFETTARRSHYAKKVTVFTF